VSLYKEKAYGKSINLQKKLSIECMRGIFQCTISAQCPSNEKYGKYVNGKKRNQIATWYQPYGSAFHVTY